MSTILDKLDTKLTTTQLIELARVAETAELYKDCYQFMSQLTEYKCQHEKTMIDVDERNILAISIKNMVGTIRASLGSLSEEKKENYYASYKQIIKRELQTVCQNAIDLITTNILPILANNDECTVFFYKLIGDLYRYLSEHPEYTQVDEYKTNAEKSYQEAMNIATAHLSETHPTRLGLALNFSVFYKEILGDTQKSCALAKQA
eukprot:489242_1